MATEAHRDDASRPRISHDEVRTDGPHRRADDQVGTPSGATVVQQATVVAPRDAVRWGPVVAGRVTRVSQFIRLSLLALGHGIAAGQAADGAQPEQLAVGGGIIAAIIGLLSFFIGGLVAGRGAAVAGRGAGAFNGFLVWGLGLVMILWLGAAGLGTIFGAAGDIFASLPAGTVDPNAAPDVQIDPAQAAETARNSALIAFASLGLPALAAALGGALGVRERHDVDRTYA